MPSQLHHYYWYFTDLPKERCQCIVTLINLEHSFQILFQNAKSQKILILQFITNEPDVKMHDAQNFPARGKHSREELFYRYRVI